MKNIVDLFLEQLRVDQGSSKNTQEAYQRDLRQFEASGSEPLETRTLSDLEAYLAKLKSKGLAATSIARKISALRQFYQFLLKEEIITDDPALFLETPVKRKRIPRALSEEDLRLLLTGADQGLSYPERYRDPLRLRDQSMIYLLYACGLRVSELVGLLTSRVDIEAGCLRVMGKRNKERVIPFPPLVGQILYRYKTTARPALKPKDESFFIGVGGRPLTRQAFWKTLRRLASESSSKRKIHPHMLRHTFATDLLKSGMNLRTLQTLLGHADLQTTEIYTHVLPERLKEVVEAFHPRGKK